MYNSEHTIKSQPQTVDDIFENVRLYFEAGLHVVPLKTDGSKSPILNNWTQPASRQRVLGFYCGSRPPGIGILCGEASGGLEVIDFDLNADENYAEWCMNIGDHAFNLPAVKTAGGGVHVYYRCPAISGNTKLAMLPKAKGITRNGKTSNVLIETRGQGGQVAAPGGPPRVHKTCRPYEVIRGNILDVPTVHPDVRDVMWQAARDFDEGGVEEAERVSLERVGESFVGDTGGYLESGYEAAMSWPELLEPFGWHAVGTKRDGTTYWERPGRHEGTGSATTRGGCFYVFTTESDPFETNKGYGKWNVLRLLGCGGDAEKAKWVTGQYAFISPKVEEKVNQIVKGF